MLFFDEEWHTQKRPFGIVVGRTDFAAVTGTVLVVPRGFRCEFAGGFHLQVDDRVDPSGFVELLNSLNQMIEHLERGKRTCAESAQEFTN